MAAREKVQISQEAFDSLVKENMEDFDMPLEEALQDAINTLKLQGVDLKGIIMDGIGGENVNNHPIVKAIKELECATTREQFITSFEKLYGLCLENEPEAPGLAGRYGGVEATITSVASLSKDNHGVAEGLKTLNILLKDPENRDKFRRNGGCEMLMTILADQENLIEVKTLACEVLTIASTEDELAKEQFMDCNAAAELPKLLKENAKIESLVVSICNAFRSLVTADDNRLVVSKAFTNARTFSENGMVEAFLLSIQHQNSSSTVASICLALKSLAVNDVICKTIAEQRGIEFVLGALVESANTQNKPLARSACSFLSQLAGSDDNKETIINEGGLEKLINIAFVFSEDPPVLQECFSVITVLSLRSPVNAFKAVKAGILDVVAEAMETHSSAVNMQRQACQMLRNLAVRSQDCRSAILEKGLVLLIRRAKANHASCKEAASAALRDLGLDDYNS